MGNITIYCPCFYFMRFFIPILSILSLTAQAQNIKEKTKSQQNKDISAMRLAISSPLNRNREIHTLHLGYAKKLLNNIYIDSKIGFGTDIKNLIDADPTNSGFSIHGYGSLEFLYYFSFKKADSSKVAKRSFSSPFLSLEQNIFSNPFLLINQNRNIAFEGSTANFINVGYQIQNKKLFLRITIGYQLLNKDFSVFDINRNLQKIHGGLSLGLIF
jgi:hypothetical protein